MHDDPGRGPAPASRLGHGAVVFVSEGKNAESLLPFWRRLRSSHAKIKAVARDSGIRVMQQMAKTLMFHAFGLLAWYDYPISTGPLEGTNNKIKTMQRQAYGFRDQEFFKLKIYAIHETKYALVG